MNQPIFQCAICDTPYLEVGGKLADALLCEDCICRDEVPENWRFESIDDARSALTVHVGGGALRSRCDGGRK